MKNFIEVTELTGDLKSPEIKRTLNINYLQEYGEVKGCDHKSYLRTSLRNMMWIKEDIKTLNKKILNAQK